MRGIITAHEIWIYDKRDRNCRSAIIACCHARRGLVILSLLGSAIVVPWSGVGEAKSRCKSTCISGGGSDLGRLSDDLHDEWQRPQMFLDERTVGALYLSERQCQLRSRRVLPETDSSNMLVSCR